MIKMSGLAISFRTKLLFYFLILSTLIIVVGIIFYKQLVDLITPLEPESIPYRVDQLVNNLEKNELLGRLMYRHVLMQKNLENYVFTNKKEQLQDYYLNLGRLLDALKRFSEMDAALTQSLKTNFNTINNYNAQIIDLMAQGQFNQAKASITSEDYIDTIHTSKKLFEDYLGQKGTEINEEAAVTVKLAAKNSVQNLQNSLQTSLVLFFNALLISFAFAFISARTISNPLNTLRNDIEKMNKSNLEIPITSKLLQIHGDVGDLARSFSDLINKLRVTTVRRDELLLEIEQRKKFEETLRQTAVRLKESNRELDQFAYIASHDLRAPLRAIESLVDWIKEDCYDILPEDSRHNFDLIKKRAQRLESLINGILEYSRAGKITTREEKLDLGKLIFEIIESLAPPPHIEIMIDTPMPTFFAHRVSITQVFLNLISNAIKYQDKPKGHIHIGCVTFANYYQFYVADDGPGIEKVFYNKVFEIFQTLQSRDTVEGAGIGLSIVKKIIEKQGGKIWIDSQVGKGTTFYFTWNKVE